MRFPNKTERVFSVSFSHRETMEASTITNNMTWDEMNADIIKRAEGQGYIHYKGRAECFRDVISAFHIINEYNRNAKGDKVIRLISPNIKGSAMMDTDFDFWTDSPIILLQWLWNEKGFDLHRIIQTIKPIDKYDGDIDNTMWNDIELYLP